MFTGAAEDVVYRALAFFPFEFLKTCFGKNRSNVVSLVTEQLYICSEGSWSVQFLAGGERGGR